MAKYTTAKKRQPVKRKIRPLAKQDEAEIKVAETAEGEDESQNALADKLVKIAASQVEASMRFKGPRLKDIQKNEDLYLNKTKPALKGRFNVPLPIVPGYADTLMSKLDDPPVLRFRHTNEADLKKAKKISAAWQIDSSPTRGKWPRIDRGVKKLAIFSGVGIYRIYAESDPKYKSCLEWIDHNDFECEPQGGADLENHLFCGRRNVFRSVYDLQKYADSGLYNSVQVAKLKAQTDEGQDTKNRQEYEKKLNRFKALGLEVDTSSYVGQRVWPLIEWCMEWEGERYYIVFDYATQVWVRFAKLEEVFANKLYPYVAWHTHEDPMVFWSKGPLDDIRPVAEAMQIVFNQGLDNVQKRNWNQRAFDPNIFPNPAELEYRPDGLIQAMTANGTKPIGNGIYEFKTEDNSTLVINLTTFLDNFLGQKSGITASAQGASDKDSKVGVYYGDLQQMADRMGLYNKSYAEAWQELGMRYISGLKEHLNEPLAIKMIGAQGIGWDQLIKDDLETEHDFDIEVIGGNAEMEADKLAQQNKQAALDKILGQPILMKRINPDWTIETILRVGGFEEADIKYAMDMQAYGNEEILSEAAIAIQQIVEGERPKVNRGANTAFVQKIMDFAYDTEDLDQPTFKALIAYAKVHIPIAQENMVRKAQGIVAQMGADPTGLKADASGGMGGPGAPAGLPDPAMSRGAMDQSRSQETSEQLTPQGV